MGDDSKLSIERMIEFGMGLSMAKLFTQAMDSAHNTVLRPELYTQKAEPPKYIYAMIGGQQQGPFSLGEIFSMITKSEITPETYIWKVGMPEWKQAKEVDDIGPQLETIPPPLPR